MLRSKTKLPNALALMVCVGALAAGVRGQTATTTATAAAGAVTLDHADWKYKLGEPAPFTIRGTPGVAIKYTLASGSVKQETVEAVLPAGGELKVDGGTRKEPGFLRCVAVFPGNKRALATAAYEPEKIEPTVKEPGDFDAFWARAKADLAKVPMDAQLTPMPRAGKENVDVFQISLQIVGSSLDGRSTSRYYGVLCVPKGAGPFPAMMSPPGAGVRGPGMETTWAERGFITLSVGIHEIPPITPEPPATVPARPTGDYALLGIDDQEHYYFRRVILGCLRANDYLVSHPKWDGKTLVAFGGSQGGYLSIATAGLDPRVKRLVAAFPAFCDENNSLYGRANAWPKIPLDKNDPQLERKVLTISYFDAVNFARRLTVPGHFGWGFNDETCPPEATFAAYNVIKAPKTLTIIKEMGHPRVPALTVAERDWLLGQLGMKN